MLVIATTKVTMHQHEYLNHATSIGELRALGQEVRAIYVQLDLPAFGSSISMAERITDTRPRERPPSKRSASRVGVPNIQQIVAPPPGLGSDERDSFVV